MRGTVVLDSNLALLLVVGSADRRLVAAHKRLGRYTVDHFDLLVEAVAPFSVLAVIPQVLVETFNLARQIENPARTRIRGAFRRFVETVTEIPVPATSAVRHGSFATLGFTDAALLSLGETVPFTLATADAALADQARALSRPVLDVSGL